MKIFKLPDLGEGLPDAEIREWYIKEGDTVTVDQPLVAMETAKAVVDVPSPYAGKIVKLYGKTGDIIKTHAPLIAYEEETTAENKTPKQEELGATVAGKIEIGDRVLQEAATGVNISKAESTHTQILPALRLLAAELNIHLQTITPTGKQGEITLQDLKQAILIKQTGGEAKVHEPHTKVIPLRGARRAMAQAMEKSHREVVPVTIYDDADIQSWPNDADILCLFIQAIIKACQAEPTLNAHFNAEAMELIAHEKIHLGIAVDSSEGLIVPVIHDVGALNQTELRKKIDTLKEQVKARKLSPESLKGSTIQLSNFGTFGGRYANPIIVPPIVAIIGIGRSYQRAVAENEKLVMHRMLPISLTFDHRAITGGEATRFLGQLLQSLQNS